MRDVRDNVFHQRANVWKDLKDLELKNLTARSLQIANAKQHAGDIIVLENVDGEPDGSSDLVDGVTHKYKKHWTVDYYLGFERKVDQLEILIKNNWRWQIGRNILKEMPKLKLTRFFSW